MSFEERLRQSLQARAEDVRPDPGMWSVVQSRIRRGRTFRVALAGVATALAVAGVALAAPGLIERRIEFEPGGVATQPAVEPTESLSNNASSDAPDGIVFTDSAAVYVMGLDGDSVQRVVNAADEVGYETLDAHPESSFDDISAVASFGVCGQLRWISAEPPRAGSTEPFGSTGCPTRPVFSPDGRHVAWAGSNVEDGPMSLSTVAWTDAQPATDEAGFELELDGVTDARLEEWIWTEESPTAAHGYLAFTADETDRRMLYRQPIERQADGALVLSEPPQQADPVDDFEVAAYAAADAQDAVAHYSLKVHRSGDRWRIERSDPFDPSDDQHGFDFSRAQLGELPEDVASLWLRAVGNTLVFGDGGGKAWLLEWKQGGLMHPRRLPGHIIGADLFDADAGRSAVPTNEPQEFVDVDVFFGMTGADACVADQTVPREVEGPGVARAALTELLKGPSSRESNEGIVSPFTANTAGALNDITIVDGQARVDFADFSGDVEDDSCTKSAILDSLNKTLLQFPTVTSTRYSFDGSVAAFRDWLGRSSDLPSTPPATVVATQKEIYDAAAGRDWKALRRLSSETSCTLSDQKEPCVPFWKDQEANGEDPLGTLVDLLSGPAGTIPDAGMWVWPEQWAEPGGDYSGPRVGIDEDGVWRYFVLEGG